MSHHLDTPLAARNGQLFIDDLYVFPGQDSMVLVMDVNSNITGVYAQPGFHPEARYEFKVHFDDAEYDLVYAKPERQEDLRAMEQWLSSRFVGLDVLEIRADGRDTRHRRRVGVLLGVRIPGVISASRRSSPSTKKTGLPSTTGAR